MKCFEMAAFLIFQNIYTERLVHLGFYCVIFNWVIVADVSFVLLIVTSFQIVMLDPKS
jgi:hypothetical protein